MTTFIDTEDLGVGVVLIRVSVTRASRHRHSSWNQIILGIVPICIFLGVGPTGKHIHALDKSRQAFYESRPLPSSASRVIEKPARGARRLHSDIQIKYQIETTNRVSKKLFFESNRGISMCTRIPKLQGLHIILRIVRRQTDPT